MKPAIALIGLRWYNQQDAIFGFIRNVRITGVKLWIRYVFFQKNKESTDDLSGDAGTYTGG